MAAGLITILTKDYRFFNTPHETVIVEGVELRMLMLNELSVSILVAS